MAVVVFFSSQKRGVGCTFIYIFWSNVPLLKEWKLNEGDG